MPEPKSSRSLSACQKGVEKALQALNMKKLSRSSLASSVGVGKTTLSNFFNGKPVDRANFLEICDKLDLAWQEVFGLEESSETEDVINIGELVQSLRKQVSESIQTRCGTMRVLDMTKPIGLDTIYTDVNILERITAKRGYHAVLQKLTPEDFENFGLNKVKEKRLPGLEVAKEYGKLMLLGKPGAGKSTFLKRLAMLCDAGEFNAKKVPCFVVLRDFAEAAVSPGLLKYLSQQLENPVAFERLIKEGKLLVLLDGLDEVREEHGKRILNEIREFSERYPNNIFIVSCRIAAKEYIFEKFTDVELTDFSDKQIADFVGSWYRDLNPEKGKAFLGKLKEYPRVRELATNPLLLTMLCLLFNDSADFPSNRSELYGQALDVLLRRWDGTRNIERGQVHKKLSLDRKKDLLSQLAWSTFDSQEYFFKHELAASEISSYIRGLPNAQVDSEALLLDGQAILQSIAAQHGLLVERARGIYSYSHLSFHEYFAAWWIVTANYPEAFKKLSQHVCDRRWREIFFLATGMLRQADGLLLEMRKAISSLIISEPRMKQFFAWLNRKSSSITSIYKSAAVRAFYIGNDIPYIHFYPYFTEPAHDKSNAYNLAIKIDENIKGNNNYLASELMILLPRPPDSNLAQDLLLSRVLDVARYIEFEHSRYPKFLHGLNSDCNLSNYHIFDSIQDNDFAYHLDNELTRYLDLYEYLFSYIDTYASSFLNENQLGVQVLLEWNLMKEKMENLPNHDVSWKDLELWNSSFRAQFNQFRQACIVSRDLGHDWQFTEEEIQILNKYILANQLLVDCMNSECYISPEVREELEKNLLVENFDD
jgi:transcriptional regulator with XRE-family HTH domain